MKALSENLINKLNTREKKSDWLEEKSGGFHIWGTLGNDVIIFPDGRMLSCEWKDGDDRNGIFSEIDDLATQLTAIRIACRNIPEIIEVMPACEGSPCPDCCKKVEESGIFVVCDTCHGTGKIQ